MKNQKGLVHLSPLILIAAVGVIAFILLASSGDFQDSIFARIFPKEVAEAARRIIPPWWRRHPKETSTPTPTPKPTSTPTPTPTPAPSPISSGNPGIIIIATLYESSKSVMQAGDGVTISIARQQGYPDTPISADKVNNAISTLNGITTSGIKKSLIFSSIEDIKTYIDSVPKDVEISYNSEGGLTPSSERSNDDVIVASVKEGASIVHSKGKKFNFAPLRGDFDRMQDNGKLAQILPLLDGTGYQGQLLYLSVGEDETVATAKEKYNYAKSINPNIKFQFQMWVGRETTEQISSTFNKMKDHMDTGVIGGAKSASDITAIINGLSWR